ncbi:MAG: serine/threonine protein phosphatase, partial [Clostridia bacterium]|nr:serine/threonine protein phosphatase [Clostridia bacterium]
MAWWNSIFRAKIPPSLIFAKDGEIYNFNGQEYIVIGGAYSVDKYYRQIRGWQWFASEQPTNAIKAYVEQQLDSVDWKIDGVLTHT